MLDKYVHLGSVYYYTLTGSYWSRQSKIVAPDGAATDRFGMAVSIYNSNVLIGSIYDDDKAADAGM
jgi:hypothetical protein